MKGNFTRRHFLKLSAAGGLMAGAPYIITSKKSALIAEANAAMMGGVGSVSSPPTPAFAAALPIPAVKAPVSALSPAPITSGFQRYNEFPAKEYYDIDVKEALHNFHPALPLNPIWGYDGTFPGPLFKARYGAPMTPSWHRIGNGFL